MTLKEYSLKVCCTLVLLCTGEQLYAQLSQLPVDHSSYKERSTTKANLKTNATPMAPPFWDDFSSPRLDTLLWDNQGASLSQSIGINAPSLGVLLFDGVDHRGRPYSNTSSGQGVGDQLTSLPIALSSLSETAVSTVYLSFFWQAGGKAELPDEADLLELYFLDSLDRWTKVWEVSGGDHSPEMFTQEILHVDSIYLHENFRFRFQNSGRLSGPFDSWLIDYVYLHHGRSPADLYFKDRALTQKGTHLLGKFGAVPWFEFRENPDTYLSSLTNQFYNLDDRFRAMEYSVKIRNASSQEELLSLNANTPFNPVPLANERRNFQSALPEEWSTSISEPFDLESIIYLSSGDFYLIDSISENDTTYHLQVDYRVNDTVRSFIPLRDYYAYDNGSVDYAAGINQRSGMLAVRYDINSPAYIHGISINFTNTAQIGRAIDLMVWEDLDEPPVYRKEMILQPKDSLQQFTYFDLDTAILISDSLYVGFRQFTNDFLHVGLDKSNDSGGEISYNVIGTWQVNEEVTGSLMIRPHFTTDPPQEEEGDPEGRIIAYPNPATEKLFLEGEMDHIQLFDAFGREIKTDISSYEAGKIINFAKQQKGVYLVKVWINNTPQSIRILVK